MPFKSEKQRRYLWANEPEIARDWADTYGSRIQKNDGGIMRVGLQWGGPGGKSPRTSPSGGTHAGGYGRDKDGPAHLSHHAPGYTAPTRRTSPHTDTSGYTPTVIPKKTKKERDKDFEKIKHRAKIKGIKPKGHWTQRLAYGILPNDPKLAYDFLNTLKDEDEETWESLPQELKDLLGTKPPGASGRTKLDFDEWSMMTQVPGYGEFLSERGKPGVLHKGNVGNLGTRFIQKDEFGKVKKDKYGNTLYGYHDKPGGDGPIYYPGYVPGGSPVSGGGTSVTEVVEDTPSGFQESLTTSTSSPFDYYVGQNPTAANLAWGQKFGVDPRTMYRTSWAADGGRIGRAYGGIMDTATGRRAYGFGSIFSKIGKAAKKVLKSPIGKAALIGGLGYFGPMAFKQPAGFGSWGKVIPKTGWMANMLRTAKRDAEGNILKGQWEGLSPWKLGILGAGALPFFMGGQDENEDEGFDYDAAKNAYANEIMRIKAASMAGTLDPNKFSYLPTYKDGGRIGLQEGGDPLLREEYDKYVFEMKEMGIQPMSFEEFVAQARAGMYAGGQSVPSDYTVEDAMMTTTQDKLGGITDVMKQADLYRQGSVGQFYAADGGRIGYAMGSNKTAWGMDTARKAWDKLGTNSKLGYVDFVDFFLNGPWGSNQYRTGSDKLAEGGRIGYDAGGQTGLPPITMGQVPQVPPQMPAPQVPHSPMPAPQPNRMAMNPMMNRPMMNPMGGRRMAQEGGLMDLGGMEKDYRNEGGFVPIGEYEKKDDVPARLSKNEFVFTADAVRGAGGGDIDKGAEIMENVMKNLEQGGQISEDTQGLGGAQEMFSVSERLSEVV